MPDEHGLSAIDVSVKYRAERLGRGARRARGEGASEVGEVFAVDRATFSVARGEVVALLGPSGCGKSTLLRAVAGLEPLAGGSVSWDGEDLAQVPPHRRSFGLVFQDGQLFTHRTVAENIAYGLRVQKAPRAEREARVAELLDLVGLPGAGNRPVTALSGGERQRIALARSLAPKPRMLLLDEPLSALDQELRVRLAGDLARILRAQHHQNDSYRGSPDSAAAPAHQGTTAILVTHDENEAAAIADRTLRMRSGKVSA